MNPDEPKTKGVRFDRAFEPHRAETAKLEPWAIKIDPTWNPRDMTSQETRANIEGLKISIKARGILEAVRVRYDPTTQIPTLVYGECRVTAARELWDDGIQVLVPAERAHGDEAELTLQNLVSNTGQPLRQDEAGVSYQRLIAWGRTVDEIAAHVGRPVRYITDAIALVGAPLEAKRMIAAGEVTAARVLHEVQQHGDDAVTHLKQAVATGKPERKPLARPKAPMPSQKALAAADALAHYIHGNKELQWKELQRLAGEYLGLRGKGGEVAENQPGR